MIKVLVISPSHNDTGAFYRSTGPFSRLRRQYRDIDFIFLHNTSDWAVLKMVDIVFMFRPFLPPDVKIATMARDMGKPLWVDYDDDLFNVPEDNPAWAQYYHPDIKTSVESFLRLADKVTVTTEALRDAYYQYNLKIDVIPNAYDPDLMQDWPQKPRNYHNICWRGSNTHMRDLMVMQNAIKSLCEKSDPNWKWQFMGYHPWFLSDYLGSSYEYHGARDTYAYFRYIKELGFDIFFYPLNDTPFNRAKSNIAWIEATYAGAVTVAPALAEWDKPGIMNYNSIDEFKSVVNELKQNLELRKQQCYKSYEYIKSELHIDHINNKRKNLIDYLMS